MPILSNVLVHISLPLGIRLTSNNATLQQQVTYDVVTQVTPFYASIRQVQLAGGMFTAKLSDLTIASQIYEISKESDILCLHPPNDGVSDNFLRFVTSRNRWVTSKAARDLVLSVAALTAAPGARVLANFSISRSRGLEGESVAERVKMLNEDMKLFEVTIRSAGVTVPGGHAKARMAAKGVMDWTERTPAREWRVTGMGANNVAADYGSPTGGRGKPTQFFSSPFYSPPLIGLRFGVYTGAYPLVVTNPYPQSI